MATADYSPDNPSHVRGRKRQIERDRMREEAALRWVMQDARGRLAVAVIIAGSDLGANPFAGDPAITAFNCGRQAEAQKLVDTLKELCPDDYLLMETERLKDRFDVKNRDEAERTESFPLNEIKTVL